jgi:adenylate cyclase
MQRSATNDPQTRIESLTLALGRAARAERCSLFVVDEARGELVLQMAHPDDPDVVAYRMPCDRGIAGFVRSTACALRVDDAYANPFFNPELDRATGFRTRSILCVPVRSRAGRVIALVELLNPLDRSRFDELDEALVRSFEHELRTLIEQGSGAGDQDALARAA